MKFPIELKKGKEKAKCLHAVDLKGWLDAGWKLSTEKDEEETPKRPNPNEGRTKIGL